MRFVKAALFLLGFVLAAHAPADARTLIGLSFGGQVFAISPETGQTAELYSIPGGSNALTPDGTGNFVVYDRLQGLVTYDVLTGAVLDILALDQSIGSTGNALSVRALTRTADGSFFFLDSPEFAQFDLYEVDGETGTTTLIGQTPVGTFGQALTIDLFGRMLTFSNSSIVEIDPTTAQTTDLFPRGIITDRQTLFSDEAGTLFAGSTSFFRIDPVTGAISEAFTALGGPSVSFIRGAYITPASIPIPVPAPVGLLASGLVLLGLLRRRQLSPL